MAESVSLPETWRGLDKISARGIIPEVGEVTMLIASNEVELGNFVRQVWEGIDSLCAANGVQIPVTEQELGAYFRTALDARVARVRNERSKSGTRVEDGWALPDPFQYVIAAIGRVELSTPNVVILPRMAPKVEVLDLPARDSISRKLRSLQSLGLRLSRAIEAKREGVARVMRLTLTDVGDDVVLMDTEIFSAVDAMSARAVGMRPDSESVPTTLETVMPSNPLWVPSFRMWGRELVVFEHKFTEIPFTRASA
jgi:hypothetical protein